MFTFRDSGWWIEALGEMVLWTKTMGRGWGWEVRTYRAKLTWPGS